MVGMWRRCPYQRKEHKRRNDMKRESLEGGGKVRNRVPGPDKRPQICSTEGKWHWQFTQMCCSLNFPPDQPSLGWGCGVREMKGKSRERQTELEFLPPPKRKKPSKK